ncbi:ATP-binding cassette domain-containing protein [Sunxiuqinia elliptica]|uniref:ABC transporter n=1 Tax=Sunxiuqinia elliptica TaxID=655355 RepID=A0A1I2A3T4_9BACT|nr:ATP-binding cassette domain-containing protein [Sunxiuqinia elliptica]SFE38218.1 ABC transporter [Sunxiuqinia elliptica]
MIYLQGSSSIHPDKDLLFENISFSINNSERNALIGNNEVGKATLLQRIAGKRQAFEGPLKAETKPYHIPKIFGQFNLSDNSSNAGN